MELPRKMTARGGVEFYCTRADYERCPLPCVNKEGSEYREYVPAGCRPLNMADIKPQPGDLGDGNLVEMTVLGHSFVPDKPIAIDAFSITNITQRWEPVGGVTPPQVKLVGTQVDCFGNGSVIIVKEDYETVLARVRAARGC